MGYQPTRPQLALWVSVSSLSSTKSTVRVQLLVWLLPPVTVCSTETHVHLPLRLLCSCAVLVKSSAVYKVVWLQTTLLRSL
jgi:hypothetical protein